MRLSKNFTLKEFTKSQTAERRGIDNTPNDEHLENAEFLFGNVVQKVRDHFGPTTINSGYRGPELNEAVGGSKKSQHCHGQAADIEVPGVSNYEVAKWITENCDFDQVILEGYRKGEPSSGWVHVSYNKEGNRKSILTCDFSSGKAVYTHGLNI